MIKTFGKLSTPKHEKYYRRLNTQNDQRSSRESLAQVSSKWRDEYI